MSRFDVLALIDDPQGWRCSVRIPASSPYFDGHFPQQPVLPGVAQLQIVLELVRACLDAPVYARRLRQVRFRERVGPGAELVATIQRPDAQGDVAFRMEIGGKPVVSGRMTIARAS